MAHLALCLQPVAETAASLDLDDRKLRGRSQRHSWRSWRMCGALKDVNHCCEYCAICLVRFDWTVWLLIEQQAVRQTDGSSIIITCPINQSY